MGFIHANIILSNPCEPDLTSVEAFALVDKEALFLCIPEHISIQLKLKEFEKREVTVADGSKKRCSYVEPIKINFSNRMCLTGALVLAKLFYLVPFRLKIWIE